MNFRAFPWFPTWLIVAGVVLGCAGGAPSVDLGDGSTGNLVWGAVHYGLDNKDYDKGVAYADKALELHGAEARAMQASLTDFPPTDPPEATFKYKALNDVGLIALVKGEILRRKGDRAGAAEAWSMVIEDFGYAQVQELGEWQNLPPTFPRDAQGFIKLADVAKLALSDPGLDEN